MAVTFIAVLATPLGVVAGRVVGVFDQLSSGRPERPSIGDSEGTIP